MIEKIANAFSPSGNEDEMRQILFESLNGRFDEICIDSLGNVIAKKGEAPKLLIECGMDTAGIMITDNSDGKLYFSAFGGLKAKDLIGKNIVFGNGSFGEVKYDGEESDDVKISDLYIAIDNEEITVGDFGVLKTEFYEDDDGYLGYGLKNKVGLLAVCQATLEADGDFAVLFSAQKRIGGKGIKAFLSDNSFECAISVDGFYDKETDGTAIIAKDSTGVATVDFRKALEAVAISQKIDVKTAVLDENFFGSSFLTSGQGIDWTAIGISTDTQEDGRDKILKKDLKNATRLLKSAIEKLNQ